MPFAWISCLISLFITSVFADINQTILIVDMNRSKQILLDNAIKEYQRRLAIVDHVIENDRKLLKTLHRGEINGKTPLMPAEEIPSFKEDFEETLQYRKMLIETYKTKEKSIQQAFVPLEEDYTHNVFKVKRELPMRDSGNIIAYPELLETMIIEKQKATVQDRTNPMTVPRVRVGGIACDDMKVRNILLTKACEKKVMGLLTHFGTAYYYELIPILDEQPLTELNHLKGKVPPKTIRYLQDMILKGIAQTRISELKVLMRKVLGQKANIDYPLMYIQRKNRRGFALRVYR